MALYRLRLALMILKVGEWLSDLVRHGVPNAHNWRCGLGTFPEIHHFSEDLKACQCGALCGVRPKRWANTATIVALHYPLKPEHFPAPGSVFAIETDANETQAPE